MHIFRGALVGIVLVLTAVGVEAQPQQYPQQPPPGQYPQQQQWGPQQQPPPGQYPQQQQPPPGQYPQQQPPPGQYPQQQQWGPQQQPPPGQYPQQGYPQQQPPPSQQQPPGQGQVGVDGQVAMQMPEDMRDWPYMAHVMFRLGHFFPVGGLESGRSMGVDFESSLGENTGAATIFFLGGGFRVNQLAFDLSFGIGGSGLDEGSPLEEGISAGGWDPSGFLHILFGVEGTYYFWRGSDRAVWPFVGLGLYYNGIITGGSMGDVRYSRSYGSFHFRPMAGIDFPLAPAIALGAAFEMGLGAYGNVSESVSFPDDPLTFEDESYSEDNEIENSGGMHAWIGISVRLILLP